MRMRVCVRTRVYVCMALCHSRVLLDIATSIYLPFPPLRPPAQLSSAQLSLLACSCSCSYDRPLNPTVFALILLLLLFYSLSILSVCLLCSVITSRPQSSMRALRNGRRMRTKPARNQTMGSASLSVCPICLSVCLLCLSLFTCLS